MDSSSELRNAQQEFLGKSGHYLQVSERLGLIHIVEGCAHSLKVFVVRISRSASASEPLLIPRRCLAALADLSVTDPALSVVEPARSVADPARSVAHPDLSVADPSRSVTDPAVDRRLWKLAKAGGTLPPNMRRLKFNSSVSSLSLSVMSPRLRRASNARKVSAPCATV